jgi:enamine deaminase RidA (YjgF/YER057c/UK114 family)
MARQRTFSGTPWEAKAGYCRAMRIGNQIFVAGTAPVDDEGDTFAPGDAYAQTMRCFAIIQTALQDLGADLEDIVRTRLYITDMGQWEEIAQAHNELFADYPPVSTMVEIPGLINPDMLVEVEVEALCEDEPLPAARPLSQRTILGRPIQPADYPPIGAYPPVPSSRELDEGCLD